MKMKYLWGCQFKIKKNYCYWYKRIKEGCGFNNKWGWGGIETQKTLF